MRGVRSESGSALVAAMAVMMVMMMAGLATYATVDAQQNQSGNERIAESSFNVSEAALDTEAFVLSRDWPGTADQAYPSSCTESSTARGCPDPQNVRDAFDKNVDVGSDTTWATSVHDNGGSNPNFYDDATVQNEPAWDANQDQRVWVRAEAVARGRRRVIVALVKVDLINEQTPLNAITAGHFSTNNNGNKTIVDTKGRPLALRCKSQTNPNCAAFRDGQVSPPDSVQEGYSGGNALSEAAIDRLRTRAIAEGTYYANGCPGDPSGAVVFVEQGDCSYNTGQANSPGAPGAFIIMNGTLYLGGNFEYYGLLYMGNRQNTSGDVVTMRGTSLIQGSIAIDGDAGIEAGASSENVIFDPGPAQSLRSYGSAGIVQNSWREIKGG